MYWKFGGISCLILFLPPLDPDTSKKLGVWIRIHMDIFGILDQDPHENLCESETLPGYGSETRKIQSWIQNISFRIHNNVFFCLKNYLRAIIFKNLWLDTDFTNWFGEKREQRLLTWFSYSRLMTAVHLATPERGRVE